MASFSRAALTAGGFEGFLTFDELRSRIPNVPTSGGVYIVLRGPADEVAFLDASPGGRFKGRDRRGVMTQRRR